MDKAAVGCRGGVENEAVYIHVHIHVFVLNLTPYLHINEKQNLNFGSSKLYNILIWRDFIQKNGLKWHTSYLHKRQTLKIHKKSLPVSCHAPLWISENSVTFFCYNAILTHPNVDWILPLFDNFCVFSKLSTFSVCVSLLPYNHPSFLVEKKIEIPYPSMSIYNVRVIAGLEKNMFCNDELWHVENTTYETGVSGWKSIERTFRHVFQISTL